MLFFSMCTHSRQNLWLVRNLSCGKRSEIGENYARGRTKSLPNFEVAANAVAFDFEVHGLIAKIFGCRTRSSSSCHFRFGDRVAKGRCKHLKWLSNHILSKSILICTKNCLQLKLINGFTLISWRKIDAVRVG